MTDSILKVISTVDSNRQNIPIVNGQLIFVKDTHTVYLDMGGIRTTYNQITIMPTESYRLSLLAPTEGFYFCHETSILWYFKDDWVQITSQPAEHFYSTRSYLEFPSVGHSNVIYIDTTDNKTYRWDDTLLKYFVIGSDYSDIKIIYGGSAN